MSPLAPAPVPHPQRPDPVLDALRRFVLEHARRANRTGVEPAGAHELAHQFLDDHCFRRTHSDPERVRACVATAERALADAARESTQLTGRDVVIGVAVVVLAVAAFAVCG
jgi:hypothetical protein